MKTSLTRGCLLTACMAAGALSGCSHPQKVVGTSWNPEAAAAYLDQREVTWMGWPGSARDHGTFCISCHTGVPYALARPALRRALAEQGPSVNERKLLENVTKRVRLWADLEPFYSDKGYDSGKATESRGTEAVLNALVLASNDGQNGRLEDTTRVAFTNMWALQQPEGRGKGSWSWLQFRMEPWEAKDSQYYGAALAALAVGTAPENYRSTPDIQPKISMLRDYLNREYAKQSTINRVMLLLASLRFEGLIDSGRRDAIIREVSNEQRTDGGWELASLAWPSEWSLHSIVRARLRSDWSRQDSQSDGYATALIVFTLGQAGIPPEDPRLKRGLSWLVQNQSTEDGSWSSSSLTQRRNPSSNVGHFMRDAATAYAVLALTESGVIGSHDPRNGNQSHTSRLTTSATGVNVATR